MRRQRKAWRLAPGEGRPSTGSRAKRRQATRFALAALLLLIVVAAASTSSSDKKSRGPSGPASTGGGTQSDADRCRRAARIVVRYDTLLPGASRKDYLRLLHGLQSSCPREADRLGLTGVPGMKPCRYETQESCTAYLKR